MESLLSNLAFRNRAGLSKVYKKKDPLWQDFMSESSFWTLSKVKIVFSLYALFYRFLTFIFRVSIHTGICHSGRMAVRGQRWTSFVSFYNVGTRDQADVVRISRKCLWHRAFLIALFLLNYLPPLVLRVRLPSTAVIPECWETEVWYRCPIWERHSAAS